MFVRTGVGVGVGVGVEVIRFFEFKIFDFCLVERICAGAASDSELGPTH